MSEHFQGIAEFGDILDGRRLEAVTIAHCETRLGRPAAAAFRDLDSGDLLLIGVFSGALKAGVIATSELAGRAKGE